MSRRKRKSNERKRRQQRLRERREKRRREHIAELQNQHHPPRLQYLFKQRRGDKAELDFDFRDAEKVEGDFESAEDPGEAAREALLQKKWAERGHPVAGES